MVWPRRWWLRFQMLFGRNRTARQLDDEIRFHLDQQIAENISRGLSPQEARYAAMRAFGNPTVLKEETRDTWGWTWLDETRRDLRYGFRVLCHSPGFSAAAVVSLALGIMAATAMYSVIYGAVLNPFPYRDVDSLMSVKVGSRDSSRFRLGYTVDQFLEIAERNTIFNGTIASTISDVVWSSGGEPQRLRGNISTMNTFEVLGVPPLIGRTPSEADRAPGAPAIAVLGYKFWMRQFAGDPGVLGRPIVLNGAVRTVVGVMPPRFMWRGADVYLPIVFHRGEFLEGVHYVHLLGRLKPGVTEAQAESDLRPIIADLKQREPAAFPDNWRVGLLSFRETFPSGIREVLWILFGAVGMLLLIACSNVSNLLLSRAATRQREIAVRASLGATRGRLMRQLLTESVLLAALAGAIGAALAFLALPVILAMVPRGSIPDEAQLVIDRPVLLFTFGASLVTALLFGLTPALHASRGQLLTALQQRARGAGSRRISASGGLVALEVAMSLVLVVGATLMIRTVLAIENENLGIRTDRLLTIRVPLSPRRYQDPSRRISFFEELLGRVEHLPGVEAAGINTGMHPFFGGLETPVSIPGAAEMDTRPVLVHEVSREYLKVFGISLLEGRPFSDSEIADHRQLAIVNQSFVHRYFPDRAPVGRVVRIPRLSGEFHLAQDAFQIVGVVRDAMNRGLTREVAPELYLPYTITGDAYAYFLAVLTNTDPTALAKTVSEQVYALDRDQPVTDVRTLDSWLDDREYSGPRFSVVLLAIFAVLGLILAVVGVYGVVSNAVAQRTHEIGVRKALGASSGDVLRLIFRFGAQFILPGIGLGVATSLAMGRVLRSQLWGVSPHDPMALVSVGVLLLAAGFFACWLPARRAIGVDPMVALRYE